MFNVLFVFFTFLFWFSIVLNMSSLSEDLSYDEDLATCIQAYQTTFHLAANITNAVHTREAQTLSGPPLVDQLNSRGTTEIAMELSCPPSEYIVRGSLLWCFKGTVTVETVAGVPQPQWQSANHGGANFYAANPVANNNGQGHIEIPPLICNCQLTCVDFEVGRQQSVNVFLPQARTSEFGAVAQAAFQTYFDRPRNEGCYIPNNTGSPNLNSRMNLTVADQVTEWEAYERVASAFNNNHSILMSHDYDDHETRLCFPRGMSLTLRAGTREYDKRTLVHYNFVQNNADPTHRARLRFTSARLFFTTYSAPPMNIPREPTISSLALIDIGIRTHALHAGQRHVNVPITHSGTHFVPFCFCIFIGGADIFDARYLGLHSSFINTKARAILKAVVRFDGNNSPEFTAPWPNHTIDLRTSLGRMLMFNAFLSRSGVQAGNSRSSVNSLCEHDILTFAGEHRPSQTCTAANSLILITDPSITVVREASSGQLTGRCEVLLDLDGNNIEAADRAYVVCFSKHQVSFKKKLEVSGATPAYEVDERGTRPAFTSVFVEEASQPFM